MPARSRRCCGLPPQTVLGVAIVLSLHIHRWAAFALLGLFLIQFAIPSTTGRLVLCVIYLVLATVLLIRNRQHILPTLRAPFQRHPARVGTDPERELVESA